SILTGNLALGYVCLKALIHDLFHRMLVSAIKDLIPGRHSRTPDSGKSLVLSARIERRPNGAIDPAGQAEGKRASGEDPPPSTASRSAAPAEAGNVPGEAARPPTSGSIAPADAAVGNVPGEAVITHTDSSAAPAEAAATVKPVSGKRSGFREAGGGLTW